MRSPGPLAVAAVCCAAAGVAGVAGVAFGAPPRHPAPLPSPPAVEGTTSAGVVVLRAPGAEQVLLRAGTFTMGSDDSEYADAVSLCRLEPSGDDCRMEWFVAEQPDHQVYLSDYWIDRREVTVARYRACVAGGACDPPPYDDGGERFDRADFPVVLVSWNDARRFCTWDGGRLPTEAEWERAARGPSDAARGTNGRRYPWGNVYNPFLSNHGIFALNDLDDLDARDGFLELAPVGSFPDGRTPEGIDDLAGNVDEWVADWFAAEYPRADAMNPKGPDNGERRVVRGGSYRNGRAWLRGASRDYQSPGERSPWLGFRCARDASR